MIKLTHHIKTHKVCRQLRHFNTFLFQTQQERKPEDIFKVLKEKPLHNQIKLGYLFNDKDKNAKKTVKVERTLSLSEEQARKIVDKLLTVDHSIDSYRKELEDAAKYSDKVERVNSILWKMQRDGKAPDYPMKLLIEKILQHRPNKPTNNNNNEELQRIVEETKPVEATQTPIFPEDNKEESNASLVFNEEKQRYEVKVMEEIVLEKFSGRKPGEEHKPKGPPPQNQEGKNFKDRDFFEPIKAAPSLTKRETEETVKKRLAERRKQLKN
ncbi:hypothetical protein ABK040_014947 [Willaertia magna]